MGFLNSLFGGAPTKYDAQKYFDYAEKQYPYLEVIDYQLFVVNTVEKWIGCYLWVYGK